MRKKREIDAAFLSSYKDMKIEYPFCYKSVGKHEENYFRYLEDGRYEYICISEKKMHMSYGTRVESIQGLLDDDNFYFKTIANRETVITNEDFEFARKQYYHNYQKYLSADQYLSREVEELIQLKEEKEDALEEKSSSSILSSKAEKEKQDMENFFNEGRNEPTFGA